MCAAEVNVWGRENVRIWALLWCLGEGGGGFRGSFFVELLSWGKCGETELAVEGMAMEIDSRRFVSAFLRICACSLLPCEGKNCSQELAPNRTEMFDVSWSAWRIR